MKRKVADTMSQTKTFIRRKFIFPSSALRLEARDGRNFGYRQVFFRKFEYNWDGCGELSRGVAFND